MLSEHVRERVQILPPALAEQGPQYSMVLQNSYPVGWMMGLRISPFLLTTRSLTAGTCVLLALMTILRVLYR